jgi:hypothetical protein
MVPVALWRSDDVGAVLFLGSHEEDGTLSVECELLTLSRGSGGDWKTSNFTGGGSWPSDAVLAEPTLPPRSAVMVNAVYTPDNDIQAAAFATTESEFSVEVLENHRMSSAIYRSRVGAIIVAYRGDDVTVRIRDIAGSTLCGEHLPKAH